MTIVGHVLTGTAIGTLAMPRKSSLGAKFAYLVVFIFLAELPDLPLPSWGHDIYYFSHSLFINLILIGLFTILPLEREDIRRRIGGWPVVAGGVAAWLSHLLLDTFYNHGEGLLMFWPFSIARLALPIPWLTANINHLPVTSPEVIRIFLLEFATFLPLVVITVYLRLTRLLGRYDPG